MDRRGDGEAPFEQVGVRRWMGSRARVRPRQEETKTQKREKERKREREREREVKWERLVTIATFSSL